MKKRSLQVLDSIEIKSPCHESWEKMVGGDSRRFCESCQYHVTDISKLTKGQAARLISSKVGQKLCVRYSINSRGHIIFRESRSPIGCLSRFGTAVFAMLLGMFGLAGRVSADVVVPVPTEPTVDAQRQLMGDVVVAPENTPQATPAPESTPTISIPIMGKIAVRPRPPCHRKSRN